MVETCQVIRAPSLEAQLHVKSIFLAGAIDAPQAAINWREQVIAVLGRDAVTIFDPHRSDWDSTWKEDVTFEPFRIQVEWELEKLEASSVVLICFDTEKLAPISLLEFGMCVKHKKAIVVCSPRYPKRGNVEIVCQRHGVPFLASLDEAIAIIRQALA